jgi:hypothetical protein
VLLVEVVPDVDPGPVQVNVADLEGGEFVDAQAEIGGDHERVVKRAAVRLVDVVECGPEAVALTRTWPLCSATGRTAQPAAGGC